MPSTDAETLRQILREARVIAVVGHSDKPQRTSYRIAQRMRDAGYTVYPVNPTVEAIDGQPSYPTLAEVPAPVDIVNVFRRAEHLPQIAQAAVAAGAKVLWAQEGVSHPEAARIAEAGGLRVVMDRCIYVAHRQLMP